MFRLRSGVFVGGVSNAGMCDSFGTVQFSGKREEKWKRCKVSAEELEAREQEIVCSPC